MQPICRLAPARPRLHACAGTTCQARAATTSRGRVWCVALATAPRPRLRARASCGRGATGPVEARKDVEPVDQEMAEAGPAPEELEVLEEEAVAGEDEGRQPADYDRRAHIFEESSRVFRELKHRRDGDGDGDGESGSGHGGVAAGATAAGTGTREQQQLG